ncbi:chain length determinant protein EpsF [Ferribacterium limneticum]|uniref:chain length determinant protein EpsF n=1 Tax=Ferribacterium limneticum TaxID=76259 RepID=UPI001CFA2E8A|nr:chain length determinant protein EpsF [Ferribacterium limneticum]UCV29989.1 chain length determinant protein EpsF [Ferribacterium limneticum]UCV33908.1 chain length determinant protein EpsF [Ferribacterium limneticum]
MTLQQFLLILWARRKLVIYIFLGTIFTVLGISLILPEEFSASTAVVLDVKSPDPVAGVLLPGLMAPAYMATQVDIINSERVANKVVRMLRLDENPTIREQWQEATEGKGQIGPWLAALLLKRLDVKPARDSNVITISFSGSHPAFAATMANAFAQAYIDVNLELRIEPARQNAKWFDEQSKQYRERLETAQKALSDYQQKSGIVATDERLDYETQKLNELSTQLTVAQAQGTDASSKRKSTGSADTMPEVMQSPLVSQMKGDIARLEARLKEVSGNFGENHPQYLRSQAELAELKSKMNAEIGRITSAIGTAGNISKQKEGELVLAVNAQKTRILKLKEQRDEISLLVREVETAQRAFDAIGQRTTQSRLESQSIQTNVSVLNPANEPLKASKPRVFLNVLISIFLGALLGVGAALTLELLNRRIRSTEELASIVDLPVLVEFEPEPQGNKFWSRISALLPNRTPKTA